MPEYDQVLLVTNRGEDWTYSFSAELRGLLASRLAFMAGYSYAGSYDKMSLTAIDMISNIGLNATREDPNDPLRTASNFDRPHKVVLSLYGAPIPGWDRTELSLLYRGQSGLPFSYVYRGDLNGDGYPGLGPAFDRNNDIIYVPDRASEVPAGFGTTALLASALETDACLAKHRGEIPKRNACRAPWQHSLDMRITQSVRIGAADVRLEADIINLLNLINSDWGTVRSVRSNVPLLELDRDSCGPGDGPDCVGELFSSWAGGALPSRGNDRRIEPAEPWSYSTPDSQWQAQFGVRVTFDG